MNNRTALITGASSGLGCHLAKVFAENEYNLILSGRNSKSLTNLKQDLMEFVNCSIVGGDLRSQETLNDLSRLSEEKGLDILINNAGLYSDKKITDISPETMQEIIELNLIAPMKLTQRLYPLLKGKGTIINIGSIDGIYPKPNLTAYCASKFGLRGFTDSLKFEAKNDGIRVIGVYLGGMQTPMNASRGVDISKAMNPQEVAEIIFNASRRYESSGIDEIVINRQNY